MLGEAELNETQFPSSNDATRHQTGPSKAMRGTGPLLGSQRQRPPLPASGWMGKGKGLRKSKKIHWARFWGPDTVISLPWIFGYMKVKRKKGKSWRKDENVRQEAGALIIQEGRSEEWTWEGKARKRVLCCVTHSPLVCFLEPRPGALCPGAVGDVGCGLREFCPHHSAPEPSGTKPDNLPIRD